MGIFAISELPRKSSMKNKNENEENIDVYDFVEDIFDLFDDNEEEDKDHETVVESNETIDLHDESSQEDEDKNKNKNKNDAYEASRGVKQNGIENKATETPNKNKKEKQNENIDETQKIVDNKKESNDATA